MNDEPIDVGGHLRVLDGAERATWPLPLGPRSVLAAAVALGWRTGAWVSRTETSPILFAAASGRGDKSSHSAGDVRFGKKITSHTLVEARAAGEARLGFAARWATVGTKTAFESAVIYDPVGLPTENIADYSVSEYLVKLHGPDKAEQIAWRRSAAYNDGSLRLEHSALLNSTTPFFAWVDEWLGLIAPAHKTLSRKTKETTKPGPLGLESNEWSNA